MSKTKNVVINGLSVNVPVEAEANLDDERYLPSIHVTCYRGVYQIVASHISEHKVEFSMALGGDERADIVNHSLDKSVQCQETLQKMIDAAEFLLQR